MAPSVPPMYLLVLAVAGLLGVGLVVGLIVWAIRGSGSGTRSTKEESDNSEHFDDLNMTVTRPCSVYFTPEPTACDLGLYDRSSQDLMAQFQAFESKTARTSAETEQMAMLQRVLKDRADRGGRACKVELTKWKETPAHPRKLESSVPSRGPPEHWAFCYQEKDPNAAMPILSENAPWVVDTETYTLTTAGAPREYARMRFTDLNGETVRAAYCKDMPAPTLDLPAFMLHLRVDPTMHVQEINLVKYEKGAGFQKVENREALVPMLFSLLVKNEDLYLQPRMLSATVYRIKFDACDRPSGILSTGATKLNLSDWGANPTVLREYASAQDAATGSLTSVANQVQTLTTQLTTVTDAGQRATLTKRRDDLQGFLDYVSGAASRTGLSEIDRILKAKPVISMVPSWVSTNDNIYMDVGAPYQSMALQVVPMPAPPPPPAPPPAPAALGGGCKSIVQPVKRWRTSQAGVGKGGVAFDFECPAGQFVNQLNVRSGAWVDRVQAHCSGGKWSGAQGGGGGSLASVASSTGFRRLTAQHQDSGHVSKVTTFNLAGNRVSGPHGTYAKGGNYDMDCGAGAKIVGITGRSGGSVDRLGVVCEQKVADVKWCPPPPPPPAITSHTTRGCEEWNSSVRRTTVACPARGTIIDGGITYGRWNNSICPHRTVHSRTPARYRGYGMPGGCVGRNSCTIAVGNYTFGQDIYPNVYKHFDVNYRCSTPR